MLEDKNIGRKSSKTPKEFKNLDTLDEPVCETIVRPPIIPHHFDKET
jgi:hypothetical protein